MNIFKKIIQRFKRKSQTIKNISDSTIIVKGKGRKNNKQKISNVNNSVVIQVNGNINSNINISTKQNYGEKI